MEIGTVFPTCEIGDDPGAIRAFGQAAEELGYSHIVSYDHVLGAEHTERNPPLAGAYTERDAFHEPFTLFGFLAGATERIELATGVLILPQRQTALVAKQAAELDLLSRERLRLGVGSGWNHVEYTALGERFDERGLRLDEQVDVLRALWAEEVVDFDGRFHRIERAGIRPRPRRSIPIWFGGSTLPALRRAARKGDGFIFGAAGEPMQRACAALRQELDSAGRDADDFGIEVLMGFGLGPDVWRSHIDTWRNLGATAVSMRTMTTATSRFGEPDPGFSTPDEHIVALERFMDAVGDAR